ncbi:MAG: phosphoglycerate kinase [Clostridia bacterium]|nr:phosphoglycerate kinase [Clostridia bacterium]
MTKKTVRDIDVKNKRVLVRVDFNVPLDAQGQITDDTRIRAALPTIKYLQQRGAKVILVSHLGRPKKPEDRQKLRMDPVARRLGELLGTEVKKADEVIGPEVEALAASLQPGQILLLENVRFHAEEEKNDPAFSAQLARLAEVYVNDAFGTAHRAHASTEGVAHLLPAVAGFLVEKEISTMGEALEKPERPFVAVIGGAKVSDKIGVLENLISKVDKLIIGGGMANTFLAAEGKAMGRSLVEADKLDVARRLEREAKERGVEVLLPVDLVVAADKTASAPTQIVAAGDVPDGWMALDIGPETQKRFAAAIEGAKTVVWNGPMGVFELEPFKQGTVAVAQAMAACRGTTIAGGGDSVAALEQAGLADKLTHVSTGGGASLEFLEGKSLPGIAALQDA